MDTGIHRRRRQERISGSRLFDSGAGENCIIVYLRSDGEWRRDHVWDELDTRNNPFPNPMPDEAFELVETIPNDALRLEQLPSPDADGTEVWRFADTFNGSKYWGSLDRCAEVANEYFYDQQRDANLTELRTALFFECRRWHYFGELPDRHESAYVRGLVEKIRAMIPPAGSNEPGHRRN